MDPYKKSGVDIEAGNQFVREIKRLSLKTARPEVLAGIGGFAGLFALPHYKSPVLVASTDGVGTKILLAARAGAWEGIGVDGVAMCVNDVACTGASPLFFLDYLAAGKLNQTAMTRIVAGMAEACQTVGCALLGGETAEMPGVYPPEKFDVAGFAVGAVEKEKIVDGRAIRPGDAVIGVASSGFHSNGYSLIRKILDEKRWNLEMPCAETGLTLLETLLIPTKLYSPLIGALLKEQLPVQGIAHITGGGLIENPPRVLPRGLTIAWKENSWPVPEYMRSFQTAAGLDEKEFRRVFNAGIGLVLIVPKKEAPNVLDVIKSLNEKGWLVGEVRG